MPDDSAMNLLAKFTLDLSSWKDAVTLAKAELEKLASSANAQAAQSQAQTAVAVDQTKVQIAQQKVLVSQTSAQVGAQKAVQAAVASAVATTKAQAAAQIQAAQVNLANSRAASAAASAATAAINQQTAAIRQQIAQLALQAAAQRKANPPPAGGGGHGGLGNTGNRAAIGSLIRMGEGNGGGGVRVIETFLSRLPGVSTAISMAFAPLAVAELLGMVVKAGTALYNMGKEALNAGALMKQAFASVVDPIRTANDELQQQSDKLDAEIAKLEHKPESNGAVLAIDAIIIAADKLTEALAKANNEMATLVEKNKVGLSGEIFKNQVGSEEVEGVVKKYSGDESTGSRGLIQNTTSDYDKRISAQRDSGNLKAAQDLEHEKTAQLKKLYDDADKELQGAITNVRNTQAKAKEIKDYNDAHPVANPYGAGGTSSLNAGQNPDKTISMALGVQDFYRAEKNKVQLSTDVADKTGQKDQLEQDNANAEKARAAAEQLARERLALARATAQGALEAAKIALEKEQEANEEMYRKSGETAEAYYAKKKELNNQALANSIAEIEAEAAARRKDLDTDRRYNPKMTKADFTAKSATIDVETQNKIDAARLANQKENFAAEEQQDQLQLQARLKAIGTELEASRSANQEQQEISKNRFSQGIDDATTYLNARLDQINLLKTAEISAAQQTLDASKQTPGAKEQYYASTKKALEDARKQLDQEQQQALPNLISDVDRQGESTQSQLQSRMAIAQSGQVGREDVGTPTQINQQMQDAMQAQINNMEDLLKQATPYSKEWDQIYQGILKSTNQLDQMKQQAAELADALAPVGSVFSALGAAGSKIFTSKYGQGFSSALSGTGASLEASSKLKTNLFGTPGAKVDPELQRITANVDSVTSSLTASQKESIAGFGTLSDKLLSASQSINQLYTAAMKAADALNGVGGKSEEEPDGTGHDSPDIGNDGEEGDAASPMTGIDGSDSGDMDSSSASSGKNSGGLFGGLFGGLKKELTGLTTKGSGSSFTDLASHITSTIGAFSGFASAIQGAQSGGAGALAGGVSGAGLGNSLGGPIGAGIGAAGGALLGLFTGQKEEQLTQDITNLGQTYKGIMNEYSSNNASLQATVQSLQALISAAEADEASTKKGGSQFAALILQYQDQINQLNDQASQTMASLKEQLAILSSPTPYQQLESSIQGILQQYEQFAGAASNAQELAQANQFLNESLQQLSVTYATQLNQNEQDAVTDALTLNSLLNQRNALQYQYLQTVESTMAAGNLTRNQTRAQSDYSKLYQAQVQHQQQLDDLNQQIAVEQYKVSQEQLIFQLATTKAGLEAQSLQLQEVTIQQDMARISAMQNLLQTLEQTGYSIPGLSGVSSADPNTALLALLQQLLQALGVTSAGSYAPSTTGPSSATTLASLSSDAYAKYGQQGIKGANSARL